MSENSLEDLNQEMRQLEKELLFIKRGANMLTEEVRPEKKSLSTEEKRNRSRSAWARSTTVSGFNPATRTEGSIDSAFEISKADRYAKVRPPSFTMGSRSKLSERCAPSSGPMYNYSVDVLSSKKRPRSSVFSKTSRPLSAPSPQTELKPETVDEGGESEHEYEIVEMEFMIPSGYSFGNAQRFPEQKENKTKNPVKEKKARWSSSEPDVIEMETQVPSGYSFGKATRFPEKSKDQEEDEKIDAYIDEEVLKIDKTTALDNLAYRPRSTSVKFVPERKFNKASVTGEVDLGVPGPGQYEVDEETLRKTKDLTRPVGTLYREKVKNKNPTAAYLRTLAADEKASRGPGAYNVERADAVIASTQPSIVLYSSQSKATPHTERKKYFEQKARDMREAHDHMKFSSVDLITPRAPMALLAPPKSSKNDAKRTRILKQRRIEKMNEVSRSHEAPRNLKYSSIERRAPTGVTMAAEVSSRRSTQDRLQNKPAVASTLAERIAEKEKPTYFYGPQLQVPWAPQADSAVPEERKELSPTEEVLRMLGERGAGALPSDDLNTDPGAKKLTEAFLRSTHSGSLLKKPAPIRMNNTTHHSPSLAALSAGLKQQYEFLGPQLQSDWVAESTGRSASHKNRSLLMEQHKGRDQVRVHQKGVIEVVPFQGQDVLLDRDAAETKMRLLDELELGPGEDDDILEFGRQPVKGVPFSKVVAREDLFGAFGERPPKALEEELYFETLLDIDYSKAKDATMTNTTSFRLYLRERNPETKNKDPEPTPFEKDVIPGMFEEVTRAKSGRVEFAKMTGRPAPEVDDELTPVGGLDLEVQDWKPSRRAQPQKVVFSDPKKHPRFPKDPQETKTKDGDNEEGKLPPSPKFDLVREREKVLVDMGRMTGRPVSHADEDLYLAPVDEQSALAFGQERAAAIQRGQDATKPRVPSNTVNMGVATHQPPAGAAAVKEAQKAALASEGPEPMPHDHPAYKQKVKGGPIEFGKAFGREEELTDGSLYEARQELDLEPHVEASSRHKRVLTAPKWDSVAGERFTGEEPSELKNDNGYLDIADVDPGAFKPGKHGLNGAKVPSMDKQSGRQDVQGRESNKHENLLLIEPKDPHFREIGDVQSVGWDKGDLADKRREQLQTMREEEQRARESNKPEANPSDEALQKKVHGSVSFSRQTERPNEIISPKEGVLDLDPAPNPQQKRTPQVTVMASKTGARATPAELQAQKEYEKQMGGPGKLEIEPKIDVTQKRTKGGTSMARSGGSYVAKTKGQQEFDKLLRRESAEAKIDAAKVRQRLKEPSTLTQERKKKSQESQSTDIKPPVRRSTNASKGSTGKTPNTESKVGSAAGSQEGGAVSTRTGKGKFEGKSNSESSSQERKRLESVSFKGGGNNEKNVSSESKRTIRNRTIEEDNLSPTTPLIGIPQPVALAPDAFSKDVTDSQTANELDRKLKELEIS